MFTNKTLFLHSNTINDNIVRIPNGRLDSCVTYITYIIKEMLGKGKEKRGDGESGQWMKEMKMEGWKNRSSAKRGKPSRVTGQRTSKIS